MSLLAHATCLPQERNHIALDPDVKDAWGLPAMRITFDYHPDPVSFALSGLPKDAPAWGHEWKAIRNRSAHRSHRRRKTLA